MQDIIKRGEFTLFNGFGDLGALLRTEDPSVGRLQPAVETRLAFGEPGDPTEIAMQSRALSGAEQSRVWAAEGEAGLAVGDIEGEGSLRMYPDRAELDVPLKFAVLTQAPEVAEDGWAYFDIRRKALRVYVDGIWMDMR